MEKSLLIDLDGVLRIENQPADGLHEFLEFIQRSSINACIISNSTLNSSKQVYEYFHKRSIEVNIPIMTAIEGASIFVRDRYKRVAAYTSENVIDLFAEFLDYENPEAVVIGDIGNLWNYTLMQTIFEYLRNGADLIAAHKNKFWSKPEIGIQLDAGPFIHALEYAVNTQAELIGKPSPLYFKTALRKINSDNNPFIMIGDDLESDISGAKKVGGETILIYSGKTKPPYPELYSSKVDFEANNLVEVIKILETIFN